MGSRSKSLLYFVSGGLFTVATIAIEPPKEVKRWLPWYKLNSDEKIVDTLLPKAKNEKLSPVCALNNRDILRHYPSLNLPSYECIVSRQGYLSSISYRFKQPNWVAEKLTRVKPIRATHSDSKEETDGKTSITVHRKHSKFISDPDVPEIWSAQIEDYQNSGYSRGHLAACGLHRHSQEEMNETFYLSGNILPHDSSVNGSDWYRLECLCGDLVKLYEDVYCVSGPLWLPDNFDFSYLQLTTDSLPQKVNSHSNQATISYIGKNLIPVPTHTFKIIVVSGPQNTVNKQSTDASGKHDNIFWDRTQKLNHLNLPKVGIAAFILPNKPIQKEYNLKKYQVPIAFIEKVSGLNFDGLTNYVYRQYSLQNEGYVCDQKLFEQPTKNGNTKLDLMAAQMNESNSFDLCKKMGHTEHNDSLCDVKCDKRVDAWRAFGKLSKSTTLEELQSVWNDVQNKNLAESSYFLKNEYNKKKAQFERSPVKLNDNRNL